MFSTKFFSRRYEHKLNDFMAKVIAKNPSEVEFHQAVHEVVETIIPFIIKLISSSPRYLKVAQAEEDWRTKEALKSFCNTKKE